MDPPLPGDALLELNILATVSQQFAGVTTNTRNGYAHMTATNT